ncbi:MAG: sigma-70 family RNA polymerase sigma factor [Nitrososphaerales archaeon]
MLLNWLLVALSFATFGVFKGDTTRKGDGADLELVEQQAVLDRAKRADPSALGMLYDLYVDRIYVYIYRRIGQADVAEDLTGQVFMRMLEAVRTGHGWETSFSGWLYRIAHNLVIDYYRRKGRATFVDIDDAAPMHARSGDPVLSTESQSERQRLRQALAKLTDEQSQVISLRFLEDLSISEVAVIMQKTEGAVKALQYRAVLALRRVMQP